MLNNNICIIGGAGHVGAPLGIAFSSKGHKVLLIDKNKTNINKINNGQMPFLEDGCEKLLPEEDMDELGFLIGPYFKAR